MPTLRSRLPSARRTDLLVQALTYEQILDPLARNEETSGPWLDPGLA